MQLHFAEYVTNLLFRLLDRSDALGATGGGR
jgi:hypothetical protein